MLTQVQVEEELQRLSGLLEARTTEYAKAVVEAATAEVTYLEKHATWTVHEANRAVMQDSPVRAAEREARVRLNCQEELAIHKIKEAQAEGIKQALYSLRTQINALQTVSANIRSQT